MIEQQEHPQRDAIKQALQDYVQGNPETHTFRFFLPSTQDLDLIKHAAATTSLSTGKRIHLIYPTGITREE